MRVSTLLGTTLAAAIGIGGGIVQSASAIQLADGTVYFEKPPSLVSASTTFNTAHTWGATYYFTLSLPENAGEPLQRVTITQQEGIDSVEFDLEEGRAYEGGRRNSGPRIALGGVTQTGDKRSLDITFSPPVPPGRSVTIELKPVQNPRYGGVYLFGVTAFPAGEKSHGQFLGFGRLHFYESGWD
jgi:Protein of unknown function (DUF2808)